MPIVVMFVPECYWRKPKPKPTKQVGKEKANRFYEKIARTI